MGSDEQSAILLELCTFGDAYTPAVRQALDAGAAIEARNARGFTPLLLAAYYRSIETARLLLDRGADLHAQEETGGTPLYWACFGGSAELVKLFLERGARITPNVWQGAQTNGLPAIIDLLMKAAAARAGSVPDLATCGCKSLTHVTSPSDQQSKGLYTIVQDDVHQGWSEIYCICNTCGRMWKVTEDTGYHYTTYAWEELKDDHPLAGKFAAAKKTISPQFLPYSQYESNRQKLRMLIRQDPQSAKRAAEVVLFFDPDDLFALMILGMALTAARREQEAATILKRATEGRWTPAQITDVKDFADRLLQENRLDLLSYASQFTKAVAGESIDQLFAAAVARASGGDVPGAREMLERVTHANPKHFDAWYNLGLTYMESHEPIKAIPCFKEGLKHSPDNHSIQFQLARALEESGDAKRASTAYRKALKLRPQWGGQRDYSIQIEDAIARLRSPKAYLKGGHKRDVQSVGFSSDGKWLVSGSLDCTLRVWEAASGKPLMKLASHGNSVECTAVSPDGTFIVTWENLAYTYTLWERATGKEMGTRQGASALIFRVAFDSSSRVLALEKDRTDVTLLEIPSLQEMKRMSGHTDEVTCLAFHPQQPLLASGGRDTTIRIWNTNEGAEVQRFENHSKLIGSVAFSPDGRFFASGDYAGLLCIRTTDGWKTVAEIKEEGSAIKNILFSRDSARVYFISHHTAAVCELASPKVEEVIPDLGVINCFAISPDNELIATGHTEYDKRRLRVWNLAPKKLLWKI